MTAASEAPSASKSPAPANEPTSAVSSPRPPIGLVIPTLVLIVYWAVTEASYQLEMGMFYRFITRMIALLLLLLYSLGWGLTRRHFTWGQRGLALAIVMGTMFAAGALGHRATGIPATGMMGLPIVITLSVGWLWGTRHRGPRLELSGIAVASLLVFGLIALLRWDGLDGRQQAELSWRWTPSGEERFRMQSESKSVTETFTAESRPPLQETVADWSRFRGGDRESVVDHVVLGNWSKSLPNELWRRRVGPGWSSVIEIDGYLFTQEQRDDREAVVCYHARTGQEVWVHSPNDSAERFNDSLSGTGPRATPTFHRNRIYAYGAKGRLECLDAVTGQPYWSHSLFAIAGAAVPQWGAATSPIIVDDKVVVFAGGKGQNSLLAFDRTSGELRWKAPGGTVSYSTPQVMTIAGQRQIVMHDDAGLSGVRIEDGTLLWTHASPHAGSFQPMLQPHRIANDRLLINWDSGLLCLQIRRDGESWKVAELWSSNRLKPSFNDIVIHGDYVYGLDDGILCCVDLAKGQRQWKRGRYGFGQMLLLPASNELLVLSEQGEVIRVAADPKEHRELGRFKAIDGKTWNHPILVHGRLIVRNSEEMACFEMAPLDDAVAGK